MAERLKWCSGCQEEHPISDFNRCSKSGFQAACRAWKRKYNVKKHRKNTSREKISIPETKTCSQCHFTLPTASFSKDRHQLDGLQGWCKDCRRTAKQKDRSNNPEKWEAYSKLRAHLEEQAPGGPFDPRRTDYKERFEISEWMCWYCVTNPHETPDHVCPLSRGGTNNAYNIVACCNACQIQKSSMTMSEWITYRSQYELPQIQPAHTYDEALPKAPRGKPYTLEEILTKARANERHSRTFRGRQFALDIRNNKKEQKE